MSQVVKKGSQKMMRKNIRFLEKEAAELPLQLHFVRALTDKKLLVLHGKEKSY